MSVAGVTFEPLPHAQSGKGGRSTKHTAIAAELKARPGEWARIETSTSPNAASSMANHISGARLKAYAPAGSFEAVSRTVDGEYRVYARYVGAAS